MITSRDFLMHGVSRSGACNKFSSRIRIGYGWILLSAIAVAVHAASVPPPKTGTGALWGKVRLVPREGVRIPKGGTAYQDRELRDVEFVDYSQPGFVVVFLEGPPVPTDNVALKLTRRFRLRIEPPYAAIGHGGTVSLRNDTAASHVISCPDLDLLRRLAPGEELTLVAVEPGPLSIHVLDGTAESTVFVAPGPYDVVSKRGRFNLTDLVPGPATLRAWHPRFPADAQDIVISPDRVERVDLEIGVDRLRGPHDE